MKQKISKKFKKNYLIFFFISVLLVFQTLIGCVGESKGPLRVSKINPRYFADGSGKVIYLTGLHTWNNVQDITKEDDNHILDFSFYLDMLQEYNLNFTRLWAWKQAKWHPHMTSGFIFTPTVYMRTGPGNALDGKPKFDLNRFNQEYFNRLRARVIEAGRRGIYVSVMLFEGWSIETKGAKEKENPWLGHPFHRDNNVDGIDGDIDGDNEGKEVHTMSYDPRIKAIRRLQEDYVKKVIDTLNEFDNFMWEISNESHRGSAEWEYYMINFIKRYEAEHKPKKHLVWMTSMWEPGNNEKNNISLFNSPADAVSPNSTGGYRDNPPAADGSKIIIADTDHLWGVGGNYKWVWKSFLRGLNPVFMDPYDSYYYNAYGHSDSPFDKKWEPIRRNLGYARTYAEKIDLASVEPLNELASTSYCLANPGSEYLIYQPESDSSFAVNLEEGSYYYEWFNLQKGIVEDTGEIVVKGDRQTFNAPFTGDAVLYLKK